MVERVEVAIGILVIYFVAFAVPTGIAGRIFSIHKEIIRKVYHIFGSASMILLLYVFPGWKSALISFLAIFIFAYVLILAFGGMAFFKKFRIDRKREETKIKQQILYVSLTYSVLIIAFWAIGGEENKHFILFGVLTWCFGDAFAAIFGRLYGKKYFQHRIFDQNKTHRGFKAFVISGSLVNMVLLIIYYSFPAGVNLGIAVILGVLGGMIELMSKKGLDNVLLPIGITIISFAIINAALVYW